MVKHLQGAHGRLQSLNVQWTSDYIHPTCDYNVLMCMTLIIAHLQCKYYSTFCQPTQLVGHVSISLWCNVISTLRLLYKYSIYGIHTMSCYVTNQGVSPSSIQSTGYQHQIRIKLNNVHLMIAAYNRVVKVTSYATGIIS